MSTTQHTPEPWNISFNSPNPLIHSKLVGEDWYYSTIASVVQRGRHPIYGGEITDATAKANAARIVACVNGCAGISDPETTVPELVAALETLHDLLEKHSGQPPVGLLVSSVERAGAVLSKYTHTEWRVE